LVIHPGRPETAEVAKEAARWLTERGHDPEIIEPELSRAEGQLDSGAFDDDPDAIWEALPAQPGREGELRAVPLDPKRESVLKGADLAVSLGGDGTMLRTVSLALSDSIPVLGVNLGHLGYLTEIEPAGLTEGLQRFIEGNYRVEERMTLEVKVSVKKDFEVSTKTYVALNEAVVEKVSPGHTVRLVASIGNRPFVTYAADGLLVATPTGTTAYNLSARGPIVSPRLSALVVTPISPHMLFDRALVLDPQETLELEVAGPRSGVLVIDGLTALLLRPGDGVECATGPDPALLVRFSDHDFHSVLRARFHLADG
jgi:NAD+ kinase